MKKLEVDYIAGRIGEVYLTRSMNSRIANLSHAHTYLLRKKEFEGSIGFPAVEAILNEHRQK